MNKIYKKNRKGVATLPTVIMIGGIIIELAIAGVVVGYAFTESGSGMRLSTEALFTARAGADDAIYKVIRGGYQPSYTLIVSGTPDTPSERKSEITIEKDPVDLEGRYGTCNVIWGCYFRVRSLGLAANRRRKIESVLSVDPATREIRISYIKEIPV
ncbi:MAG TPA: hypothetical protein PKG74_00300 [Candidatus Colwellbacteria bacterium]|nr:hypothetical protein [Candidatus Colwellbacteria bacterium]